MDGPLLARFGDIVNLAIGRFTQGAAKWDWVRPRLVLAAPGSKVGAGKTLVLSDLDAQAHAAYGLDGLPTLVLVRPDGHIAFRGPASDPKLLRSYCERVFGESVAAG